VASGVVASARPAGESSDPVLEELAEAAEADEELFRPMGAESAEPEIDPHVPIDLRMNWTAVGLRQARPGAGRAELIPVLIASTVTPFAQTGRRSPLISKLDYEAALEKPGRAHTVGIFPDSETVTRASMEKLTFGIGAKGSISFPCAVLAAALPPLALLPGLTLEASASADATFQVGGFQLTAVQIRASDLPDAGAKWQLYRVGQELSQAHHLFHVILAPASVRRFRVQAKTAITCRTWYGKSSRPMLWQAEPVVHTLDREDLDWS
jgi:hypothetical protein